MILDTLLRIPFFQFKSFALLNCHVKMTLNQIVSCNTRGAISRLRLNCGSRPFEPDLDYTSVGK